MLELMPNDIIYQWNRLKKDNEGFIHKKSDMYTEILHFKAFVEGNVYPVFHVTQNCKRQ